VTNFHQKVQRKKRKSRNFLYASLTQSHHQTKKLDNQTAYLEFNYLNIISVCFFNDLSSRQKKKQIQSKQNSVLIERMKKNVFLSNHKANL
jgi:hypothetical protein